MEIGRRLPVLLELSILVLGVLYASRPAWTQGGSQVTTHRIVSAKLVSPGIGWVSLMRNSDCAPGNVYPPCPPMRLYWTRDNGKHWRNITPPGMSTRNIRQVFFVDTSHGWLLTYDALGEESNAPFYLFTTEDAGRTWSSLILRRPAFNLMDDYTFPTELFFSDRWHGWMLWDWAMMHSRRSFILATDDGGRSWKRLPDPPFGGTLEFTSPRNGWMIGTSERDFGIPVPENDAVWRTDDGGHHWLQMSLPLPEGVSNEDLFYSALKCDHQRDCVVLGERRTGNTYHQEARLIWISRNGGKKWVLSELESLAQRLSLVDGHIILSRLDKATRELRVQEDGHVVSFNQPLDFPPGSSLGLPDFVNDANAWMNAYGSILSTTDEGKSFRVILPSAGEPEWPPEIDLD